MRKVYLLHQTPEGPWTVTLFLRKSNQIQLQIEDFYRPQTKLREGYVFTDVCLSPWWRGGYFWSHVIFGGWVSLAPGPFGMLGISRGVGYVQRDGYVRGVCPGGGVGMFGDLGMSRRWDEYVQVGCKRTLVVFMWGHWYLCFGLLVTSALGFKVRVYSLVFILRLSVHDGFLKFPTQCEICRALRDHNGSLDLTHILFQAEAGASNPCVRSLFFRLFAMAFSSDYIVW